VLFLVDAKAGVTAGDEVIADLVRRSGKPTTVVVNKIDGVSPEQAEADFYALGFADLALVAASQRKGVHALIDQVLADYPEQTDEADEQPEGPQIAIIGRPNVGKSTHRQGQCGGAGGGCA